MSRSCYSDDYGDDFPGQMGFFRANVERSIKGKAGQARLRELRDALLALPVKELEAETFAEATPHGVEACALGAWALARCGNDPDAARAMGGGRDADDHDTYEALKAHGWPRLVVLETIYINDGIWRHETPAQRYARVLAWVDEQIGTWVAR